MGKPEARAIWASVGCGISEAAACRIESAGSAVPRARRLMAITNSSASSRPTPTPLSHLSTRSDVRYSDRPAEVDRWLEAGTSDALAQQRLLPDDVLTIIARGEKEDGAST